MKVLTFMLAIGLVIMSDNLQIVAGARGRQAKAYRTAQTMRCRALPRQTTSTVTAFSCNGKLLIISRTEVRFFGTKTIEVKQSDDGQVQFLPVGGGLIVDTQAAIAECKKGLQDDAVGYSRHSENGPGPFNCARFWLNVTDLRLVRQPYYWLYSEN